MSKENPNELKIINKNERLKYQKLLYKYKQQIAELKQQLALTEKALKLAREYMFNVMCADDVPFESWFIECAKNDWKPS